jgi:two-component system chemotaxis response regulator CheY
MSECSERCNVGIAIVEDEKGLVKLYERIFARKGVFVCFVAYDGIDAVKKFIECTPKPHVVLMDYRLPLMNGIEATKEILNVDPGARIVFLSADISVKEEAMKAGAFIFLKKPADINDITRAVERGLGRRPE